MEQLRASVEAMQCGRSSVHRQRVVEENSQWERVMEDL